MDYKLELIAVPVSDVDRAKSFYADKLGWGADHDHKVSDDVRFVQVTPPGSACSIAFGKGVSPSEPGSLQGLQVVVDDVEAAHADLSGRGVEVGDVQVMDSGAPRAARDGDALDFVGFLFFKDPDGNGWGIQQMPGRA